MNKEWNIDVLYNGFNDPAFAADTAALVKAIEDFKALSTKAKETEATAFISSYLECSERISNLASKLIIYASLKQSANTRDAEAASALGRLMGILGETAGTFAVLNEIIAGYENLEEIIDSEPKLGEFKYLLLNIKKDSKYQLSDKEEALFAKLNISGASAWGDLQSNLTSSAKAEIDGKEMTLSMIRNLAYDADAEVRRKAYEAELKCYDSIKEAVAFSLNSIKYQVLTECALRGYESPLHKALYQSRMKKETLDALISAMEDYMPNFRRYLKAKAKYLGYEGGLKWYDLFAPVGKSEKTYTVCEARDYLLSVFEKFDLELHDLVKNAFDNAWIDFYPREGKVGGAFDCKIPALGESRVLTNFGGSFSDIVTLAHELGHSFHDSRVFCHSILNQNYAMPVAETASTFNEVVVMEAAINSATDREEKLALIESQLMDACQIICDIYSRYTFEASVFENRPNEFMNADRMCELMLAAQKKAYGDGLDENFMHPYMWLCKGHYYSGSLSFYNFPYAFGGLFARGLYAEYDKRGKEFVDTYKKLLSATSISDTEDTAKIAGIDLTDKKFWASGLESIVKQIDEFCSLVEE